MNELQIPKVAQDWERKHIPKLTGGLHLAEKPEDLQDSQLTVAKNVRFEKNRVLVDTGYKTFGSTVRGNVRGTFQFFLTDGNSYLVCITDDTVYRWDTSITEWVYVDSGVSTTLDVAGVATDTDLEVDSITGFSDGDFIGIVLDDGTQHQTTVDGAPSGTTISITDALPSAAAIGATVLKAVELNGSASIPISIEVFTPTDFMVFTNGVDTPKKFDGSTCEDLENLPGTTFTARVVVVFKDHLIFMHTTEDGTAFPQRVRRSNTADPEDWSTGTAGFTDLFNSEDWITAAASFGPYMVIYKERSIVRMEYVGLEDELFAFHTLISGEGVRSVDSVVNLGDYHIFFGNANIYRYRGGHSLDPIGDPIYYKVFGSQGELNPAEVSKVQGIYVEELDEVWFFYAVSGSETPTRMLKYLVSEGTFTQRDFAAGITGYGFYILQESRTWNSLVGDWSAQTWEWGARTTLVNAPVTHLCIGTQVMEYNYLEADDNGEDIEYQIDTKDFFIPNVQARFDRLSFSAKGTDISVFYSLDEGSSWRLLQVVSPGSSYARMRIWKQYVSRTVRFRFTGVGSNFGLEWVAFDYTLESEW